MNWNFEHDLEDVFARTVELWPALRKAHIFLTGGTGFIGCWLLESSRYANDKLDLELRVTVLTRDYTAFAERAPHLANYSAFTFLEGDVSNFTSPPGVFTHLIHAATDASANLNENGPEKMFDTVVSGTRRVLELAAEKAVSRVLFLSSGAIYGLQPWNISHVREDWTGAPDCTNPRNAYAEGKRAAEMWCAIYGKQFGLDIVNARIFALLGPYMPLDIHFAAGNFLRDAMNRNQIIINGSGLPCRSYLYASDLTVWLWHLFTKGERGKAYNVGSDEAVSVRDLAQRVATMIGSGEYTILGAEDKGWNLGRYVPDTTLAKEELGLERSVSLDEAILRTALWNGWQPA